MGKRLCLKTSETMVGRGQGQDKAKVKTGSPVPTAAKAGSPGPNAKAGAPAPTVVRDTTQDTIKRFFASCGGDTPPAKRAQMQTLLAQMLEHASSNKAEIETVVEPKQEDLSPGGSSGSGGAAALADSQLSGPHR